ncbi:MAG: cytidylate kinase-like family protein [Bacteroidales bacterium]|nr:cytidylate kinase-like family protein [Bacteroidales bacterium]
MKVDLLKYMSNRLTEESARKERPGPVITISRLYGCPAKKIARKLIADLAEKMMVKGESSAPWKLITKEIMSESARELDMDPSKIKYVFEYEQKGLIDDIFSAHLSKYYKSDRKIRNTIGRVIRNIACEGNAVIVGRGGVAITRDIPLSLHINLEAPLEWRVLRISEKQNLSLEEAEKYAMDVDKKRKQFREYFEGKNTDYTQFDLTLNTMTLSVDEIVRIIIKAAEVRNLI